MAGAALAISILALFAAGASAFYTRQYAQTTAAQLEAQQGARSDALTPKVKAVYIAGTGAKPGRLRLTSNKDSPTVTSFRCTVVDSPPWILGFKRASEAVAEIEGGPLEPGKPLDLPMHQVAEGKARGLLTVGFQTVINGVAVDFETGCTAARSNSTVGSPLS